jgi:DNA-binding protein
MEENKDIIIKSGNKEKSINSYIIRICKMLLNNQTLIKLKAIGKDIFK